LGVGQLSFDPNDRGSLSSQLGVAFRQEAIDRGPLGHQIARLLGPKAIDFGRLGIQLAALGSGAHPGQGRPSRVHLSISPFHSRGQAIGLIQNGNHLPRPHAIALFNQQPRNS
jgi:hypothetical protein